MSANAESSRWTQTQALLWQALHERRPGIVIPVLAPALVAATAVAASWWAPALVVAGVAAVVSALAGLGAWMAGAWASESRARGSSNWAESARPQIQSARRLALFEGASWLYAGWYMTLRIREEVDRAKRYKQPLSLLLVDRAAGARKSSKDDREELERALRKQARSADLVGALTSERIAIVLPATDRKGARQAKRRLQDVAEGCGYAVGAATLADEIAGSDELIEAAVQDLGQRQKRTQRRSA